MREKQEEMKKRMQALNNIIPDPTLASKVKGTNVLCVCSVLN
jgi:hypothetical protein